METGESVTKLKMSELGRTAGTLAGKELFTVSTEHGEWLLRYHGTNTVVRIPSTHKKSDEEIIEEIRRQLHEA